MSQEFCPAHPNDRCPQKTNEGKCGYCGFDFDTPHLNAESLRLSADRAREEFGRKQSEETAEASDFESAKGSKETLEAFLRKWPTGKLADKAREKIEEISQEGEKDAREATDYALAKSSIEGLHAFLKKWPQGRLRIEAKRRLDELEQRERDDERCRKAEWGTTLSECRQLLAEAETKEGREKIGKRIAALEEKDRKEREEDLWRNAETTNSEAAYQEYLDKTQLDWHRDEAEKKLASLVGVRKKNQELQNIAERVERELNGFFPAQILRFAIPVTVIFIPFISASISPAATVFARFVVPR